MREGFLRSLILRQAGVIREFATLLLVVLKNMTRKEYTGIRSGGSKAA